VGGPRVAAVRRGGFDAARRLTGAGRLNANGVGCLDEGWRTTLETRRTARSSSGSTRPPLTGAARKIVHWDDGGCSRATGAACAAARLSYSDFSLQDRRPYDRFRNDPRFHVVKEGTVQSVSVHIPSGCWPTGIWTELTPFRKLVVTCGLRSPRDRELRLQEDRNRFHIRPDGDLIPPGSRPECP